MRWLTSACARRRVRESLGGHDAPRVMVYVRPHDEH